MAGQIAKVGFDLTVHDLRRDAAAPLLNEGAAWADSPKDVAERSDIVCTCLRRSHRRIQQRRARTNRPSRPPARAGISGGLQVALRPQDGPQGHHSGHRAGGGGGRTGPACRGVQGRDERGAGARPRGPGQLRRPHASGRARRSAGETSVEVPPLSWPEQSHPSAVFPEFSPPLDPTTLTPSCPTNCVTRRLGIKSGPPVGDTRLEGGSK